MKKFMIIITLLAVTSGVNAQNKNELNDFSTKDSKTSINNNNVEYVKIYTRKNTLKGPAYKNHKPWDKETEAEVGYVRISNTKTALQGPTFKNYKPWENEVETEVEYVKTSNKKAGLKGPAYKNHKSR